MFVALILWMLAIVWVWFDVVCLCLLCVDLGLQVVWLRWVICCLEFIYLRPVDGVCFLISVLNGLVVMCLGFGFMRFVITVVCLGFDWWFRGTWFVGFAV